MRDAAPLRGIFLTLRGQGLPLGVRDYLDALRALRGGFGSGDRHQLCRLCEALWARTEEEARLIRLLFADLPYPSVAEVQALAPRQRAIGPEPAGSASAAPPAGPEEIRETPDHESETLPVEFVPENTPDGIPIPQAEVSASPGETFVLSQRPLIPVRSLVTAWRRFRRPLRIGRAVEPDIPATIAAKCRTGLVAAPVLVPARRNQARLTVLIDVSDSMLPWSGFRTILMDSLAQGQLGTATVFYFTNVPADTLYRDHRLFEPAPRARVLREQAPGALLIVSDAGAARGRHRPGRVRQTGAFLQAVRDWWSPVAWLNPMPRPRWRGSSAAALARLAGLTMLPLSEEGVIEAVDVLRGYAA
jgi:uncharacterized protein with von Willebrand factor type A (vWA) domain